MLLLFVEKKMKQQPKISVIIPVYNVEQYLPQCLDSLLAQSFDNFEAIFINDGSKDGSLEILKKYQAKDSRVVVIDKKNEGVSVARNQGLKKAQGEYIAFLDGDDCVEPNFLQDALAHIEKNNSDILIFESYLLDGDKKFVWDNDTFKNEIQESLEKDPKNPSIYAFLSVVWNKIYRADFIKKHHIEFPVGIKTAEDVIFNLLCYFNKPHCSYVDEYFYVYRINRQGSATAKLDCIASDIEAFYSLEKMDIFQKQSLETKQLVMNKFISGIEGYINKFSLQNNKQYMSLRKKFLNDLRKKYGAEVINKLVHIKDLTLAERLFSIRNSYCKKYKIIHFLGMRFQVERKRK